MTEPPELRVSDEERERAAQEIRENFAAGRLNEEELSDRLSAVYRALTVEQLQSLRADLPRLPATPQQQRAELAQRRNQLQRRLLQETGGGVGLFAVCTVIWLTAGASGQFWPMWVALVVVVSLARNVWRLYGPAPDLERVDRELSRHADRDERRRERHSGGRRPR